MTEMIGHIDPNFFKSNDRVFGNLNVLTSRDPGGDYLERLERFGLSRERVAEEPFTHGAAANIGGADNEDVTVIRHVEG